MAESSIRQDSRPKIIEEIVEAAKAAFDPSHPAESRNLSQNTYNDLIDRTETWVLLSALNSLIKPNILPIWLREPLMRTLTLLPLRPDGVRGTMEFVFSVHPSNNSAAATGSEQPNKTGAGITHEAVAVATRLLSTVPSTMTPEDWYGGIAAQLFSLFDGVAGPELAKTAAQVVGFGILGRKQMGAPGAPGWNVFVQPLLEQINPSLGHASVQTQVEQDTEIIDLSNDRVLVPGSHLERALSRLKVLILSNPSPGLCRRVLKPIIMHLWALTSMLNKSPDVVVQKYCNPAQSLLQTYLTLFGKVDNVFPLIQNILCAGSVKGSDLNWRYRVADGSSIDIVALTQSYQLGAGYDLAQIEPRAIKLVHLITGSCSNEESHAIFLFLLRRWITTMGEQRDIATKTKAEEHNVASSLQDFTEVSVLQQFIELAPEKLVTHFDQLLDIICQVLNGEGTSPFGDDVVSVVLSLLNLIVTATSFQRNDIKPEDLQTIEASLEKLGDSGNSDVSKTARNILMLLKYRDEVDAPPKEKLSAPSVRQIEERRTYSLAMSYITGDKENPPPVVSEGLNMLSNLISVESSILDITAVTVLMSNLLKDNEDYINLRVIKVFTQLANKHPESTVQELLENYLDAQEKMTTDTRLRFGEALVQVIERLGDTFHGDVATRTGETLLSIAGRRGYRPKTMAKQAREEKLIKLKKEKSARNEEAKVDADISDDEDMTDAERANNDILAQIVAGWESKRGTEDVRMRTSALSIFGAALETNIAAMGPTLVSNAVDLCVNVLTIERDIEYGILRRAAIIVILSFVRALSEAKETGRSLGFGLTNSSRGDIQRTLEYVANTDNDGLVQQHARDVVESLENWDAARLLPSQAHDSRLHRLAGLSVNPEAIFEPESGRTRPRIEEVE